MNGTSDIGTRIRRFRELAGLSKSDLARRLRVSPTAVHNWEVNGVMPRLGVLIDMERVLEVDIIQLMAGDGDSRSAATEGTAPPQTEDLGGVSRHERLEQFRRQIAALFEVRPDRVEIVIRT